MMPQISLLAIVVLLIFKSVWSKCPNWCSSHGICTSPSEGGYCICENGYSGDDCSTRYCPKSFDPLLLPTQTNRRKVKLTTSISEGHMYGSLGFTFGRSTVQFNPDANEFTTEACNSALSYLTSATNVSCVRLSYSENGAGSYLITFNNYPLYPAENNFFTHNGNPKRSDFSCNVTKVNQFEANAMPFCEILDADNPIDGLIPGIYSLITCFILAYIILYRILGMY